MTKNLLYRPVSIAPLITFRILFGLLTLFSSVRFLALGWIEAQYETSVFKFSYYGFEWVQYPGATGMYVLYGLMILASLGILLGAAYRLSTLLFFVCFSYVELIDKTYYLNHYYFVSLVALLLVLVPAHGRLSVDARLWPHLRRSTVPAWCVNILRLQVAIVYFYAGVAKINSEWLLEAMPLRLWLPAQDGTPLIGPLLREAWVAYAISWAGMLFDCTIVCWLLWRRSRPWAYLAVVIFHSLTGYWFQIGVFPLVMSALVLVFFSDTFHERILQALGSMRPPVLHPRRVRGSQLMLPLLAAFFVFQLAWPWRYLLYDGNLFWNEEGYRFSWRVMLVEKAGYATFYVKDGPYGREGVVFNRDFLNEHQEKQMSYQPDMILQYAHLLAHYYRNQGMKEPMVRAEVYVTMNGRRSRLMVDPQRNLAMEQDGFHQKNWVMAYD